MGRLLKYSCLKPKTKVPFKVKLVYLILVVCEDNVIYFYLYFKTSLKCKVVLTFAKKNFTSIIFKRKKSFMASTNQSLLNVPLRRVLSLEVRFPCRKTRWTCVTSLGSSTIQKVLRKNADLKFGFPPGYLISPNTYLMKAVLKDLDAKCGMICTLGQIF